MQTLRIDFRQRPLFIHADRTLRSANALFLLLLIEWDNVCASRPSGVQMQLFYFRRVFL